MSEWRDHKKKWANCDKCELCETRNRTVLARGSLPCDILFIGEAPGAGENVLGRPFVGPAGKLLDQLIRDAELTQWKLAFTNLIACIPLDIHSHRKIQEPHKDHIKACSERLIEFVQLAKPKALVMVGKLSEQWVPKLVEELPQIRATLIHPAAILRADISQQPLAIQQSIITLGELNESLKEREARLAKAKAKTKTKTKKNRTRVARSRS